MAQEGVGERHLIYMVIHVVRLSDCPFFDSLFLTLFLSVCFSYPLFFYPNLELNLFLHVDVIGALALRQLRSLPFGLRPLIIILITASLSSKTYNIALEPECFVFDGM